MKNLLYIFVFSLFLLQAQAQESTATWNEEQKEILAVLQEQQEAWNAYELEAFMQGYWKSEDLKFYGSSGVTKGWKATLARYHKAYPSKEHTGTLKFVIHEIQPIEDASYYVMGEYHLEGSVGNANGVFMIIFKKIDGQWKIISDTSC